MCPYCNNPKKHDWHCCCDDCWDILPLEYQKDLYESYKLVEAFPYYYETLAYNEAVDKCKEYILRNL